MLHLRRLFSPLGSYLVMTVLYFGLVAVLPPSWGIMHDYGLTAQQYRVMFFITQLPLAAVWFAAFYSYDRLRDYARTVTDSKEGDGFRYLATGVGILAWALVLPRLASLVLDSIANSHASLQPAAIIIGNYLNVIMPLIAFLYISAGSHRLILSQHLRQDLTTIRAIMVGFITVGVLYVTLMFKHVDANNLSSAVNPYYLPGWLVIATIIIPNLFAWFSGLFSAEELRKVSRNVKGVLYRQALVLLGGGLSVVIAGSIGIQYLRTVVPRTGSPSWSFVLLGVYLIYVLMVIGFSLMIIGARHLKRIEEI